MKKAFVVITKNGQTYNNLPEGSIVGQCYESEFMYQTEVDNGDLLDVLFDDELINVDFLRTEKIGDDWVVIEDTAKKNEFMAEQVELKKMKLGESVLAYVGVLFNSLTVEDYQTLLADQDIAVIKDFLRQGALESSKALFEVYTPNLIVTQEVKDKILAKIDLAISQV